MFKKTEQNGIEDEAHAEDEGGAKLQQNLLSAAGEMPIIGPNCYGFINYLDGALLWPDQHGGERTDRGVAVLTQSSNMAINISIRPTLKSDKTLDRAASLCSR